MIDGKCRLVHPDLWDPDHGHERVPDLHFIPLTETKILPWCSLFIFGDNTMPELVDRTEAIKVLEQIRQEHAKRTCQRSSQQIANAFGYAIEVIKRLPEIKP